MSIESNKVIIVPIGIPASGKSTFCYDKSDCVIASADLFPGLYDENGWIMFIKLSEAHNWCYDKVVEAMSQNKKVYLDNTNLQPIHWKRYLEVSIQFGYSIEFVLPTHLYFHYTNPDVPEERDAQIEHMCRVRSSGGKIVPRDVIERMEQDFLKVRQFIAKKY
jgi:hypothetical protein